MITFIKLFHSFARFKLRPSLDTLQFTFLIVELLKLYIQ